MKRYELSYVELTYLKRAVCPSPITSPRDLNYMALSKRSNLRA